MAALLTAMNRLTSAGRHPGSRFTPRGAQVPSLFW
jgi:hypothetical protein